MSSWSETYLAHPSSSDSKEIQRHVHHTFLIIGKIGHGKSAAGNSILGETKLKASSRIKSKTTELVVASRYHNTVVDVPTLEETDLSGEDDIKTIILNVAKALLICNSVFHTFILVIRFGTRLTPRDRKTFSNLKIYFGANYLKDHGIIVLTYGDQFKLQMEIEGTPQKTFKIWLEEQDEDLFKECSHRIVLFNNVTEDEEEKESQRNELFQHAENLSKEKAMYTKEHLFRVLNIHGVDLYFMAEVEQFPAFETSLKILLIGKTGHGKSSTGNLILGRPKFKVSAGTKTQTKSAELVCVEYNNYDISIVDVPGMENTHLTREQNKITACENMTKALLMCNGGVHMFIFVIKCGTRFTREERNVLSDLKSIFGKDFLKHHGILAVTGKDQFQILMKEERTPKKTFNEWCKDQKLYEICPRVVLINNVTESKLQKKSQRDAILLMARRIKEESGLYTNEKFEVFKDLREYLIEENKLPLWKENVQRHINLLKLKLKHINKKATLENVEHLQTCIYNLHNDFMKGNFHWSFSDLLTDMQWTARKLAQAIKDKNIIEISKCLEKLKKQKKNLKSKTEVSWADIFKIVGGIAGVVGVVCTGAGIFAPIPAVTGVLGNLLNLFIPDILSAFKSVYTIAAERVQRNLQLWKMERRRKCKYSY